jgi:hypothetical protein
MDTSVVAIPPVTAVHRLQTDGFGNVGLILARAGEGRTAMEYWGESSAVTTDTIPCDPVCISRRYILHRPSRRPGSNAANQVCHSFSRV